MLRAPLFEMVNDLSLGRLERSIACFLLAGDESPPLVRRACCFVKGEHGYQKSVFQISHSGSC